MTVCLAPGPGPLLSGRPPARPCLECIGKLASVASAAHPSSAWMLACALLLDASLRPPPCSRFPASGPGLARFVSCPRSSSPNDLTGSGARPSSFTSLPAQVGPPQLPSCTRLEDAY
jgi:hypothetical protein